MLIVIFYMLVASLEKKWSKNPCLLILKVKIESGSASWQIRIRQYSKRFFKIKKPQKI